MTLYQCTMCEHRFSADAQSPEQEAELVCTGCGSSKIFPVNADAEPLSPCTAGGCASGRFGPHSGGCGSSGAC